MDSWDYFSGGVPAFGYFRIRVSELSRLLSREHEPDLLLPAHDLLGLVPELCMIGLASYFEAYCKDQFAAVVNICPQLLTMVPDGDRDFKISAKSLLHFSDSFPYNLGFIVAEERDFGSAKAINGGFCDLLKISPFSKSEMERFSEFLNDRNLLVHHGGVFTLKYLSQKSNVPIESIHYRSLSITHEVFSEWADFLISIAEKMANATQTALRTFMQQNSIDPDPEMEKAIGLLVSPL